MLEGLAREKHSSLLRTFVSNRRKKFYDLFPRFEIHPLFNGVEYDLAIIALKTLIQRQVLIRCT